MGEGREGEGKREGKGKWKELPPPYRAIRPVRAKLCLSTPTFSTACWAMTSPVANSTCSRAGSTANQYQRKPVAMRIWIV